MRSCSRCSAVAWRSRGNQASGTARILPSLRSTHMLSGSKCTRVALTEEFIPSPFDTFLIVFDDLQQFPQLSSVVAIIVGYSEFRFQPEFCFQIVFFNVYVNRFARRSFIGIEEKLETTMMKDDRHGFNSNNYFVMCLNFCPICRQKKKSMSSGRSITLCRVFPTVSSVSPPCAALRVFRGPPAWGGNSFVLRTIHIRIAP